MREEAKPTVVLRALPKAAVALGALATACDRLEHVEGVDIGVVAGTAHDLRGLAVEISQDAHVELKELYAARLDTVERAYVHGIVEGFEAGRQIRLAETWRDLQLIQEQHDRLYRPDVTGLSRYEQLRHCCIHVAKLVGWMARAEDAWDEFLPTRLPDLLLFGVKLSGIVGERLPEDPLPF